MAVFIIGIYKIKDARYWLMDNGTYNETWDQFVDKWNGFSNANIGKEKNL